MGTIIPEERFYMKRSIAKKKALPAPCDDLGTGRIQIGSDDLA